MLWLGLCCSGVGASTTGFTGGGYDVSYGARPLRRTIQTLIEDPLAERLLQGADPIGASYVVDLVDGAITVMIREEGVASPAAVPAEPVGAVD